MVTVHHTNNHQFCPQTLLCHVSRGHTICYVTAIWWHWIMDSYCTPLRNILQLLWNKINQ